MTTFANILNVAPGTAGHVYKSKGTNPPAFEGINPHQFSAFLSSDASNVTGDGTVYPIVYDSVSYNVGTSYNVSTGEFTAPADGTYLFLCQVGIIGSTGAGATSTVLKLNFSGGYVNLWEGATNVYEDTSNVASINGSCILTLSASDVVTTSLTCSGGTLDVSVDGDNTNYVSYWQCIKLG